MGRMASRCQITHLFVFIKLQREKEKEREEERKREEERRKRGRERKEERRRSDDKIYTKREMSSLIINRSAGRRLVGILAPINLLSGY